MTARPSLSAERVVDAAVRVADAGGLAKVSMRNVGRELGVEAMSLYHHVAGKDALLDALADRVFAAVRLPAAADPWRPAMADRATSLRATLTAHPWGLGLVESRTAPGPSLLRHHEAVLANLRTNGFDVALAAHAFSVLDAYVYGFVLTEQSLPFDADPDGDGAAQLEAFAAEVQAALPVEQYPHLVENLTAHVVGHDYAYAEEFAVGLDLILDGLARRLQAQPPAPPLATP